LRGEADGADKTCREGRMIGRQDGGIPKQHSSGTRLKGREKKEKGGGNGSGSVKKPDVGDDLQNLGEQEKKDRGGIREKKIFGLLKRIISRPKGN